MLWHYRSGALAARDFLCRTHIDTRVGWLFTAMRLCSKADGITHVLPRESRAGFIDAVYPFATVALRNKAPDPLQQDMLADLERPF